MGEHLLARELVGGRDVAGGVHADGELGAAVLDQRAAVEVGELHERRRGAADDGQHEGEAVRRRADHRLRGAADRDPGGQTGLGAGEDLLLLQGRPDAAAPGERLLLLQVGEEVELLVEEHLVVGQVEAEEREGLGERAAPELHLGAAAADRGQGGEALEDPDRVVGGQHRDAGPEADALGLPRDGGEHHVRGADRVVLAVVLAEAEVVHADLVGQHALGDDLADRLRLGSGPAVGPGAGVAEGVQPEGGSLRRAEDGGVEGGVGRGRRRGRHIFNFTGGSRAPDPPARAESVRTCRRPCCW